MKAWRNVVWAAGICVFYVTTARLGLEYAVVGQTVTLLWPPSGIALAATLIGGRQVWPGITLGAILANTGAGLPVITVAIIALGNTLEPVCGASLLMRRPGFSNALDKVSDVLALVLFAGILSPTVSASLGTLGLFAGGEIAVSDIGSTWLTWWLGDGLGVLLISPILLIGLNIARDTHPSLSSSKTLEALALIVVLTVTGQAIFGSPKLAGEGYFPVSLSMFPFAIWGALRFGPIGAATVALIACLLAIRSTALGTGPFAVDSPVESLIRWCLFADLMAITGLLLGAIRSEREQALAALRVSKKDLERQVEKRTRELTRANADLRSALAERQRLQFEMNQISEERQRRIGQELHDGLGQQLTGIALLVTSLQGTLDAKSAPETPAVRHIGDLLGEAMSMIRSLSRGLYPVALETGGLSSALHHLAEHARSFSGIQCTIRCTADVNAIDRTTALNLYRIAQEAVSNALRHSKARRIDIELSASGEQYALSIADDGTGFHDRNPKATQTLGLRSMRCRTDLIGAAIEIRDDPAGGTSVVVTGPMN